MLSRFPPTPPFAIVRIATHVLRDNVQSRCGPDADTSDDGVQGGEVIRIPGVQRQAGRTIALGFTCAHTEIDCPDHRVCAGGMWGQLWCRFRFWKVAEQPVGDLRVFR